MEKRKFTDEEIAKAILQQVEYNAGIPYIDEWGKVRTIKFTEILDFIQRLQNVEKANEEAWEIKEGSYRQQIAEQKADLKLLIERLDNKCDCCITRERMNTAKDVIWAIGSMNLLDEGQKYGDLTDEEVKVLTPYIKKLRKKLLDIAKEYGVEVE